MNVTFECRACSARAAALGAPWRCPCGGLWDVDPAAPVMLPDLGPVTLGEGDTPLMAAGSDQPGLWLKLEYVSPTSSFKARGAVVLAAAARAAGADLAVCDSSGNAGVAAAVYFARAGIPIEVFVPRSAAAAKLAAIAAHGARVVTLDGSRAAVAVAAVERVRATGAFYASHVYNPLFYEGTKQFAVELADRRVACVVVPFGNGSLVLGASRGFGPDRPRLVGVRVEQRPTIAAGLAIDDPPRGPQAAAVLDEIVVVDDRQILAAQRRLDAMGIGAEPSGAVAYAGYLAARITGDTVVAITGA